MPTPSESQLAAAGPIAEHDGLEVSLSEYWERWYENADASYEWNDGILEAKSMPTDEQFKLFQWFFILLSQFADSQKLQMVGHEIGFKLSFPDPDQPGRNKTVVRKPDMAMISKENPVRFTGDDRSYSGTIEV